MMSNLWKDSMEESFASGNYASVAMNGNPSEWQTHAAMGLIGKCREGIEGLAKFPQPEAKFYLAVAHWINGDEEFAARILREIPLPHARNLAALIRKTQIKVLAQLPWTRKAPHDLLTAAARDCKFDIQNISFHPQDLLNEPNADVHQFYSPEDPPDFYVCQMVEWHTLPPNLQELPCPTFGQTSDYDLHIQAVYPWLQVFDEFLVASQTEWQDVRRLVSVPVASFPKSFGVSDRLPPISSVSRPIDVFLSGTITHPYNPDKARLLQQLLAASDLEVRFINGFVGQTPYEAFLNQSKVVFTYVRTPGCMPTRGLEALSMGCAVAIQKGSVLSLYVGEREGVLTYDFEADDLIPAIRRIRSNWPDFEQRARQGAEIIRREFSLSRVASQYLRFLTFLAAKPRGPRQKVVKERLRQKRSILWKGWLPDNAALKRMRQNNISVWAKELESCENARAFIDMGRELILEYAAGLKKGTAAPDLKDLLNQGLHLMGGEMILEYAAAVKKENTAAEGKDLLNQGLHVFRSGLARFPGSLPLRFNLIRTLLHFGPPETLPEALGLLEGTFKVPAEDWRIDPLEDVFPWDFFGTLFNYRRYFDAITHLLMGDAPEKHALAQLILASLHYYAGRYLTDINHLEKATSLDPEFPIYRLCYAKELMKGEQEGAKERAETLLFDLAENSIAFAEAFELLEELQGQQRVANPRFLSLPSRIGKARQQGTSKEEWQSEILDVLGNPEKRGKVPTRDGRDGSRKTHSKNECLVSVLVAPGPRGRYLKGLLTDLENQSLRGKTEILLADNFDVRERLIVKDFQKRHGNLVCLKMNGDEPPNRFYNRAIEVSKGEYLTFAPRGDRHRVESLEQMAKILERRPDISLVYSDIDIVEKEIWFTPGSAPGVAFYRGPEFNRRELFAENYIGPQPMWRRTLHDRYGGFDSGFAAAGDYEFWLRIVSKENFLRISKSLGFHLLSKNELEASHPDLIARESDEARRRHWPSSWGECPPRRERFKIPGQLFTPSLYSEILSLAFWGVISPEERRGIHELFASIRDAVLRQDWTVVERSLRYSIERFPVFQGAFRTLSEFLKIQNRKPEAAELLKSSLKIHPYAAALLNELGMIEYGRANLSGAEEAFRQAHAAAPNNTDALVSLGRLSYEMKRYEESLSYLKKAVVINPDDVDAWVGIALGAIQEGDRETTESAYARVQVLAPHHPLLPALERATAKSKHGLSSGNAGPRVRPGRQQSPEKSGDGVTGIKKFTGPGEQKRWGYGSPQAAEVLVTDPHPETPIVSAVVSTYNSERFMRGLLEDLEGQTIRDRLEIVIIDSGSEQKERDIVAEFQKAYPNIKYIRTERENSHVAITRGIRMARGEYITLANTDDRHAPDGLERMAAALDAHPDVGLVYADVAITENENDHFSAPHIRGYYRWPEFDRKLLFQICYLGPQPMWRHDLHETYGYFDPEFWSAGDYELWLRFAQSEKFLHIPETLGLYFISPKGNEHRDHSLSFRESEKARERYWPSQWGMRPTPFARNPFSVSVNGSDSAERLDLLKKEAVHFFALGDRLGAENAFRLALGIDPGDGDALISLGKICFESQRPEEALEYLEKAVRENPSDQQALIALALVAQNLKDWPKCAKAYENASVLNPGHPLLKSLAKILAGKNISGEGNKENRGAEYFNRIGEELFTEGEMAKAKEQFKKSLEADPRFLPALNNLGAVYFYAGNTTQAVDAFKRVLEIDPRFSEALDNLKACTAAMETSAR